MEKLVVIVGPTASGKSELAVRLALRFGGEVVSADSRQVYKGLDIGSGKITPKEMKGVPHHLLDVASPRRTFTAAGYRRLALKAIADIQKRGKLPFLAGGSPFYVYAVTDDLVFPGVRPDKTLRRRLEQYPAEELYEMLKEADPARASTIEAQNPRRLIRALEIVLKTGRPVPPRSPWLGQGLLGSATAQSVLFLGVQRTQEELKERIAKRLKKRLKQGMIEEVQNLREQGLSFKRLDDLGLEYRYIAQYLQNKISYVEMARAVQRETERLAKRQMAWFKKDPRIRWVVDAHGAQDAVRKWLEGGGIGLG